MVELCFTGKKKLKDVKGRYPGKSNLHPMKLPLGWSSLLCQHMKRLLRDYLIGRHIRVLGWSLRSHRYLGKSLLPYQYCTWGSLGSAGQGEGASIEGGAQQELVQGRSLGTPVGQPALLNTRSSSTNLRDKYSRSWSTGRLTSMKISEVKRRRYFLPSFRFFYSCILLPVFICTLKWVKKQMIYVSFHLQLFVSS